MNSMKNDYHTEKVTQQSLKLAERIKVIDRASRSEVTTDRGNSDYRETILHRNEESDTANGVSFADTIAAMDKFQGTSVRLTNLCRMCGQQITDGIDIFAARGIELRLREKIGLHTPISFDSGDMMPRKICSECCDKLEATHLLVVTCLQTDLRLRRFLNIDAKPGYDPKYADLVTTCTMDLANEMSVEKVADNDDQSKNSTKTEKISSVNKFNCEWKDKSSNTALEHVGICPIIESSDDNNIANVKYVVHSDLNNLLQTLGSTSPRGDGRNDKSSRETKMASEIKENSRLACSNCKNVFQTPEMLESHVCNSIELTNPEQNVEFECNIVCPVCGLSFVNKIFHEKHKISCVEYLSKLNRRGSPGFINDKDDLEHNETSGNEKSRSTITNRRCGYCPSFFETRKELQSHVIDFHEGQPLYKCGMCEKTYEKWSSLDVHEATHRIDKPYLCDLCGKSFKHSNNLRGHKRTHLDESKKKRHACDVCGNAFRSRFHLREHMNQHNGNKPYTCENCGKAFYKRIQLRQHRLSHGSNKYACPICGVTFNRRGNMNTHIKRHNKSEGMYTCSVCDYKCKSMSELKMHRKQHSESDITESIRMKTPNNKTWQCKICDKSFPKRAILLNHEVTHTGDRARIECDKCGKKLANKSSLRYHNRSLHSSERPHMCQFCGDSFVSRDSRLIHERIHTGERPYACEICNMQYRCSSNLSQHMKIHSSLRPHVCQYCSKTFTRKGALNVHERIHTGFRPFVCKTCDRSFSQKNDMIKHTKTHRSKFVQCEKCDETFENKSEILKHLNVHERSNLEDSAVTEYAIISQPLETYDLGEPCSTIQRDGA